MDKLNNSQVKVELHTPVGVFRGWTSKEEIPEKLARETVSYLTDKFDTLTSFTLFVNTNEQPDTEITFGPETLKHSVIALRVVKW